MRVSGSIVLVEDNLNDAEIFQIELERAGFQFEIVRVDTETAFLAALERDIDLIVSDYTLPSFSGKTALRIARERRPDLPFIFVSGTIGEDAAIDSLLGGATDYVLKHNTGRLVPALRRALRESSDRRLRASAETTSRRSEEKYRLLFEELAIPILLTSPDGKVIDANPACARLLGLENRDQMLQLGLTDIYIDPAQVARLRKAVNDQHEVRDLEVKVKRQDGGIVVVLATMTAERSESGAIVACRTVWRDVSDQRRLEAEFRQAQKMEAIGRLAGGIAHDFNNILTVISGYSDLLSKEELQPKVQAKVKSIHDASGRAANLTRQLLAFSRKQHLRTQVLSLNVLIAQTEGFVRRIIGEDIELISQLDPGLGPVKADPGQLEQVLMNLVVNARDAMPSGGRLTIETQSMHLDHSFSRYNFFVEPGDYAIVSVSDTGCGMDEETQAQIFEPFFTTKESGKGTGLGLSTVFGIVKQSAGCVWVRSEPGAGSTFSVYLPVAEGPLTVPSNMPAKAVHKQVCKETVLLVEDDIDVREFTAVLLKRMGYTVIEAQSGREAVEVAKYYSRVIHLILTDVVMPEMSGPAAAAEIIKFRPATSVVFMSGYPEPVQAADSPAGAEVIHKPFLGDDLLETVRRVLDRARQSHSGGDGTILIVEDDTYLLSMLAAALQQAKFKVFSATNIVDARRILTHESCDLVLTDVVMPYGDGIDFAVELRRGQPQVKVIVMSGNPAALNYVESSDALKEVVTLAKPFAVDALIFTINELLGQRLRC